MKVHGKINESMEKLSWKHILIFSSLLAVLRFLACCDLKWSLRLALSYARLAVCSLRILRTAQTSLLKAISHCLMAYCLWYRLFSILTPMAESLITRSVNSHWIQKWGGYPPPAIAGRTCCWGSGGGTPPDQLLADAAVGVRGGVPPLNQELAGEYFHQDRPHRKVSKKVQRKTRFT